MSLLWSSEMIGVLPPASEWTEKGKSRALPEEGSDLWRNPIFSKFPTGSSCLPFLETCGNIFEAVISAAFRKLLVLYEGTPFKFHQPLKARRRDQASRGPLF